MTDDPLTKDELNRTVEEFRAWRDEVTAPTPAPKMRDAALIKSIITGIAPTIADLEKQVTELRARIEELERKGYVGIWKAGKEYSPQSEVTHDGARWISHKRTSDKPGTSADWLMMEKSEPRNDTSETSSARANGHLSNPRMR